MKKFNLAFQALLGIKMGLILSSYNYATEQMSPEMKTFYEQLDPKAQKQFQELDPEHKRKAMGIIEQYCHAMEECKGHREQSVDNQYRLQMQERRSQLNPTDQSKRNNSKGSF